MPNEHPENVSMIFFAFGPGENSLFFNRIIYIKNIVAANTSMGFPYSINRSQ